VNKISFLFFAPAAIIILCSCTSSKEITGNDLAGQGYIKAVIKDYHGLDGCTFILETEGGIRLEPIGLPDIFRMDGLAVWVKYKEPASPVVSICMAGKMAEIIDIKKQ
jgi:hypothetical protein